MKYPTPTRHGNWRVIDGKLVDLDEPQQAEPVEQTESADAEAPAPRPKKGARTPTTEE